jgi:hypothetical protein
LHFLGGIALATHGGLLSVSLLGISCWRSDILGAVHDAACLLRYLRNEVELLLAQCNLRNDGINLCLGNVFGCSNHLHAPSVLSVMVVCAAPSIETQSLIDGQVSLLGCVVLVLLSQDGSQAIEALDRRSE